jgi:hypothetical protein
MTHFGVILRRSDEASGPDCLSTPQSAVTNTVSVSSAGVRFQRHVDRPRASALPLPCTATSAAPFIQRTGALWAVLNGDLRNGSVGAIGAGAPEPGRGVDIEASVGTPFLEPRAESSIRRISLASVEELNRPDARSS